MFSFVSYCRFCCQPFFLSTAYFYSGSFSFSFSLCILFVSGVQLSCKYLSVCYIYNCLTLILLACDHAIVFVHSMYTVSIFISNWLMIKSHRFERHWAPEFPESICSIHCRRPKRERTCKRRTCLPRKRAAHDFRKSNNNIVYKTSKRFYLNLTFVDFKRFKLMPRCACAFIYWSALNGKRLTLYTLSDAVAYIKYKPV